MTDIAAPGSRDLARPSLDSILPIGRREIFWRAKYLESSGYLEHLPLLFWLVGDLRPATIVTLGLDDAVAHFATCQAVERLGMDALCYGIRDPHAPGAAGKQEAIAAYNARQYQEFSQLLSAADADAPDLFGPGSIDLLVLDRDPDPEILDNLAQRWLPLLSERGVLVLRGSDPRHADPARRAALRRLVAERPVLEFEHGGGVLLLAPGPAAPRRIAQLFDLADDRTLFRSVQQVFRRLGAGHAHEWAARRPGDGTQETAELARLRAELAILRAETGAPSPAAAGPGGGDAAPKELRELRDLADAQTARLASAAERAREAEAELARLRAAADPEAPVRFEEIARLTALLEEREGRGTAGQETPSAGDGPGPAEALAERDLALAEMARQLEAAQERADRLEAENARRDEEIAALTRQLMEGGAAPVVSAPADDAADAAALARAAQALDEASREADELTAALEAAEARIAALERERDRAPGRAGGRPRKPGKRAG